jgi:glycosyltransferase involved in cell wall biosynthesis
VNPPTSKIHVVHVVTRMNTGGVAVLISELVTGMDSERFESHLITGSCSPGEEDYLRARGIDLQQISIPSMQRSLRPFQDLKALLQIARELKRLRPDIVHTHTSKAGLLGRVASQIATPKARIIHTFHGHLLHGYFSKPTTQFIAISERALARISDILIAMGNEVKASLLEVKIGKPQQFQVAFPGVRENKPNPNNLEAAKFKEEHSQNVIFTFVGRLSPIKRCDRIIETVIQVSDHIPAPHFLIIGDGELRKSLEIQASGLPITFLGWESHTEDWLAISDAAILLSDNEAVPLAMIEAGLVGLPVIATNVGSMGDVVKNGINGFLVDPIINEIASKIISLSESPELRKSLGDRGKELARQRFSVEAMIKRHEEIYSQAIQIRH